MCWAFATVGYKADALFSAVAGERRRIVGNGRKQHISNLLWSFTVAGVLNVNENGVGEMWSRACEKKDHFSPRELQQLGMFYAAAQIGHDEVELELEIPPRSLLDQIEAAAIAQDVTVSAAQQRVSKCLTEMGIDHEMEVSPFRGHGGGEGEGKINFDTGDMLNIDFVLKEGDRKVALEFNGPFHYVRCRGGGKVDNGQTKFKRRLLEAGLGFSVVSIRWNDWMKASRGGDGEEHLLLRDKITNFKI